MQRKPLDRGDLTPEQLRVLDEGGDLLVIGAPGTGKTSIALLKALEFISATPDEESSVLFLSFSNAAVQRIVGAANLAVLRAARRRLHVMTFHALCFELVTAHARLVGMPRLSGIVLPHECRMVAKEAQDPQDSFHLLERSEGRCSFERLLPLALAIFRRHDQIRAAYARAYPLVFVDEYQDTSDDQDNLVDLLSAPGQVVYLGDPDQRIYDFVPSVRHDRMDRLMKRRTVLQVRLRSRCHRSKGVDLVGYGRAILAKGTLDSKPRDVTVLGYGRGADFSKKLRIAITSVEKAVRRRNSQVMRPSLAILAYRNSFTMRLSSDLQTAAAGFSRPFHHSLQLGLDEVGPAWALALTLLECSKATDVRDVVANAVHEYGRFVRTQDGKGNAKRSETLLTAAQSLRQGERILARSISPMPAQMTEVAASFSGDPRRDLKAVLSILRGIGGGYFEGAVKLLDARPPAGNPGLLDDLADSYAQRGNYHGAASLGEARLLRERLLEAEVGTSGRVVMTLHKAKGKEFDGVVIVDGAGEGDKLLLRNDQDEKRSRRLLSMAIARARYHVAVVTPGYDRCTLLPSVKRNQSDELP